MRILLFGLRKNPPIDRQHNRSYQCLYHKIVLPNRLIFKSDTVKAIMGKSARRNFAHRAFSKGSLVGPKALVQVGFAPVRKGLAEKDAAGTILLLLVRLSKGEPKEDYHNGTPGLLPSLILHDTGRRWEEFLPRGS